MKPEPATTSQRPLMEVWPSLRGRVPWVPLANLPTPVEPLPGIARDLNLGDHAFYVKRDDLTSTLYGGNKVRTLEPLFGQARQRGATHVFSTGAFGSNHATATVLHAPRAGLAPGAILFPQPYSRTALANLEVMIAQRPVLHPLAHWSSLPFGMFRAAREERSRGNVPFVMVPGGAIPQGAVGYVSAGLEVGFQIQDGQLPRPAFVVVAVGSTCTSAGLLLGFHLAAQRGIGFVDDQGRPAPPLLLSIRVTPWPITARFRIVGLAVRTSRYLAELAGDDSLAVTAAELRPNSRSDGRFLGFGYGHPTAAGRAAIRDFHVHSDLALDTTYSGKAAAGMLSLAHDLPPGPVLFWATKSSPRLPAVDARDFRAGPPRMLRWMDRTRECLALRANP